MEDRAIVELYWQRSERAIAETDGKYGRLCMQISSNMLKSHEDAEECVNDTYLTAWNTMPTEKPNVLSAYILKITRNLALKKIEYNTAKRRNPQMTVSYSELEDVLCVNESIDDHINAKELAEEISNFLRNRDYVHRVVFLRKYWFMDSNQQIAQMLGMSEGKVKMMLFRLRKDLRNYLVEKGYCI